MAHSSGGGSCGGGCHSSSSHSHSGSSSHVYSRHRFPGARRYAYIDRNGDRQYIYSTQDPAEQKPVSILVCLQEERGKGIGRHLFESFAEDLRQKQVSRFYVRTDGMCNYGFYEHMGMNRIARSFLGLPFLKSCELYQYGKELD